MYRYMCYVPENSDKNAFYDTISEIKKLYPDCTEIPYSNGTGQVLEVSDEQGKTARICITKEYDIGQISVMSETYLSKYYEDKQVSNIFIYSGNSISTGTGIILSIPFIIINLIASFAGFAGLHLGVHGIALTDRAIALILAAVYIFSSVLIKIKLDISLLKILFIQSGGYLFWVTLPVVFILAIISEIISNSWGGVIVVLFEIIYLRMVFIAIIISGIISSILFFIIFIIKKCRSK